MKNLRQYISIGVIAVSLAGVAYAVDSNVLPAAPMSPAKCQKAHGGHAWFKHSYMGSWVMAMAHTKQLTPAQAKIVAEAGVILYGDSSMQVGTVTAVPGNNGQQNYQIQINNTAGKTIATLMMNGRNDKIMPPMMPHPTPLVTNSGQ